MKDYTTRPTKGTPTTKAARSGGRDRSQPNEPIGEGRSPHPGVQFGAPCAVNTTDPHTQMLFDKLEGQRETDPLSKPLDLTPATRGTA